MRTEARKQKTRENLNKIEASDVIDFNETCDQTVKKNSTESFQFQMYSTTYSNQPKKQKSRLFLLCFGGTSFETQFGSN